MYYLLGAMSWLKITSYLQLGLVGSIRQDSAVLLMLDLKQLDFRLPPQSADLWLSGTEGCTLPWILIYAGDVELCYYDVYTKNGCNVLPIMV